MKGLAANARVIPGRLLYQIRFVLFTVLVTEQWPVVSRLCAADRLQKKPPRRHKLRGGVSSGESLYLRRQAPGPAQITLLAMFLSVIVHLIVPGGICSEADPDFVAVPALIETLRSAALWVIVISHPFTVTVPLPDATTTPLQ